MELAGLLPIIAIAAIFWLLIIRPASRRQKQMMQLQSGLGVEDRVVLTSGIHGTVTELGDATVDVEVAQGVVLTVARGAIGSVVPPEVDETAELDGFDESYDDGVPGDDPGHSGHHDELDDRDGVDLDQPGRGRTDGDR